MPVTLTCERCGRPFDVWPSTAARGRRWCSRTCYRLPWPDFLWANIDVADCWAWTASTDVHGYGRVAAERGALAHRAVWTELVGPIPGDTDLDHLCRNPSCVNPDHLEPVDRRTNVLRGYGAGAKFARRDECVRGHPLTGPEADLYEPRSPGERRCRPCNLERLREWRRNAA